MSKILALPIDQVEVIALSSRRDLDKVEVLMSDYVNQEKKYDKSLFKVLCELASTCSLLITTFEIVKETSEVVKENYYKIEPFTYETIKTSLSLVKYLKSELESHQIFLEDQ